MVEFVLKMMDFILRLIVAPAPPQLIEMAKQALQMPASEQSKRIGHTVGSIVYAVQNKLLPFRASEA